MQAIQNVLLGLVNRHVSPYVENLNYQDLSGSILSGNLQVHGLRIKKSLLERFGFPVEIIAGDIGTLSISVPWGVLKNQPARIILDDVYVLARARPQGKVDEEEDERVEQSVKQQRLKSAEEVDKAASMITPDKPDAEKQTYIGAMVQKIVDNLQIEIKGIHVRYEDDTNTPEHPFAAGITLTEFRAVSADENWVEAFISNSLKGVHKLVKLQGLSVYFDTDAQRLMQGDREDIIAALKAMLERPPKHQYILKPVTGEARVIVNHTMSNETPKVDAQVIFDEIGVVLDRDQYRDALSVLDVFHFYRRTHQYHKFRPPESEFQANPARARLMFALNAISAEVRDKNKRWTWDYLSERRDMRKQYVEVYVKRLALPENKTLPPEDASKLETMEKALAYEDIRFFRSVARAKARQDEATRRKLEAEKRKNEAPRQTWGEWLWGANAKSENGEMTEAEKKELDDIIDYDATAAVSVGTTPKDFIKARVSARLNKGSLALRTDPHGDNRDVISLVFDTFTADATQFTDSVAAKLALGGFSVYDGTKVGSLYPQIVRVKDRDVERVNRSIKGFSVEPAESEEADGEKAEGDKQDSLDTQDPFFVLEAEHNPLDGRADNAVTVKMRHLEIIYHKQYVESVVQFFKPPESQLESIGALLDAAGQTLDGLRKETRAGLEYALEQHKTVDLKVDMNAPIIIIPMDVTRQDSQALVLDAGHIAVVSKLADKDQIKDVQSKRGKQYSQDDYKQLEDLMYDRLSLRLEATQLLMGGNVESCLHALDNAHSAGEMDLHILERINMGFTVQNAIVNAPNLTRFKIAGDLPELQVNFSDTKYKTLMRFIDIAIPKFGDDAPAPAEIPAQRPKRDKTFRPPPIEEYNLDDNRSIRSLRMSDDETSSMSDRGEKFYEAHDDTTDSQRAAMQQISFEFSFQVGKVQASLFRSTADGQERALADATLEGFGLTFALRQYDMSVDLFLRNVTLAMVEQGKIKRPLLSSVAGGDASSDMKLVKVRYMKVQKNSPEYMTKHDGVDQSVETELSTFKITVAPEPILALNDFIMTTFVSQPDQQQQTVAEQAGEPKKDEVTVAQQQQQSADKIRVRVRLTSAQISLENNDQPFALLALTAADVAIMLRSGTMRVGARLGNLTLEDVTADQVANPAFKKLLAIEGSELADFSYETYDATDEETFPGYNSAVRLRTGSLKFTFMETPVRNLYAWALKFARLKAVYDAASQAAANRAAEVTRMHYDIVVKTPIVMLPRDGTTSEDALVFRLGEISAKNEYLADIGDTTVIDAGLRGINVTSDLFVDGTKTTLTMVDDVAITASVHQVAKRTDKHKADTVVKTDMTDVKMSLTQRQYALLMSVLQSLPRALSDASEAAKVESGATTPVSEASSSDDNETSVDLRPELSVSERIKGNSDLWTSLDVQFAVTSIALEVFTEAAITLEDQKQHSIARFALVDTTLSMKQLNDGAMEAEFGLKTISFSSTRSGKSAFRDIIPAVTHGGKQIMMQYTKSGGPNGTALAIATIDSPKIVLSVDPLAALLEFAVSPFKKDESDAQPPQEEESVDLTIPETDEVSPKQASLSFRIEVIQSTILVLADDTDPKSQAIQLHVKEILLSQQSIMALKVDQLSMSFGRMDKMHDRVSFLDRLNIALSLETRQRGTEKLTSFDIDIPDPIIFRASYSDIMLIVDIVNKATAAATKAMSGGKEQGAVEDSKADRRTSVGGASSIAPRPSSTAVTRSKNRKSSISTRRRSTQGAKVIVSKEQLKAHVNGFQLVLIGDLQEIPFVHLSTDEFQIAVNDWSGDMRMATSMTTSIRYFNPSNSYFEPLMDPWKFNFKVNRVSAGPDSNPMDVSLTSSQRLELNISAAFIELMLSGMASWGKGMERLRSERGTDAPFRIRNMTGKQLALWCESRDPNKPPAGVKLLDDGGDVPWRFEDRRTSRDNVSGARHNSLGVHIQDTPWEAVRRISVDHEGEHVLMLRPKIEQITHQLMCDITVENNVKIITFRSTMNVQNDTSFPIEMVVVDAHGKAAAPLMKIPPGSAHPLPLTSVYDKRFRLRPLRGFNFDYNWSMPIYWKHLVSRQTRPISCGHREPSNPAFYFQAKANQHSADTKTSQMYPRMTLTLRPPIEIENLLPCDINYKLHDKNTGTSSTEWLMKGGATPIHTVELSHLLLISLTPIDTGFKQSDYAIINQNSEDPEFEIEKEFTIADARGLTMSLKLNYITYPEAGGAKKIQIYSSYVFMNKTGLPFNLVAPSWNGSHKEIAGNSLFAEDYTQPEPTPFLLNFPHEEDKKPKLLVALRDSSWSKTIGFGPPSADMVVQMSTPRGTEYHAGFSYAPGTGKYALTRVVTLAPRWFVVNNFEYPIRFRQEQTDKVYEMKAGGRLPLLETQNRAPLHLCFAADSSTLKWSAPVGMNDIGRSHVVLHRQASDGPRKYLVRVETHIQGASLFVYISREKEPWPIRIRNDTALPLSFQQTDEDRKAPDGEIRDLPPHQDVEYTWDQPTASKKRIRIAMQGVPLPSLVDVMAMGVQPPIKLPRSQGRSSATLSIDVRADGASQLLVISPYDEETSVYKPARRKTPARSDSSDSLSTLTTQFEAVQVSEKPSFTFTVDLEGIGVSLIDKRPQELVYLTMRGLRFGYADYPHYYDTFLDLKWIQIDNQLFGASFPIVLFPVQVPSDMKELEGHPTIQTSVAVLKDRSHGVVFVKYATILLQEIALELDEGFLFALLEFSKLENASTKSDNNVLLEYPTKAVPEPDISSGQADYFFEFLQLQPIALKVSFMRSDRSDSMELRASPTNPVSWALNSLTMALVNINEAPLNFRSLLVENGRMALPALQERVMLHYKDQVAGQAYRIVGSADFLGNPVGLFNNLGSAVGDIFYEPYLGVVMHGNKDIGLGIARGASSFAKKTVFGITDSMTKFTSSIGKGLSAATLDNDYQARRRMAARRNKPKHAIYGVAVGASAFANSVSSAFEGVASMPMQGIEKDGAAGFAKGVGKGFVGLFTKPVVGVVDFLSHSTEGIRNTTTVFDQGELDKVRNPRFIAADGVIRPFSAREALGQSWLRDLDSGRFKSDTYVAHLDVPGDDAVTLLSNQRLCLFQLRKLKLIWEVPFSEVGSLSLAEGGIGVILRDKSPGPFIPIPDRTGRDWFFKNIGKVVTQYNRVHAHKDDA